VFVYLANTAVLCYSLTIICCCQVQNYIYWIISTENDHNCVLFFWQWWQEFNLTRLFIWPSMWTRLEHAHCLETVNNMWFLGKREIARMLQHVVFVYLANTTVLCYSLTIICCCQVQNYIYRIISTKNDHRHHRKFIKTNWRKCYASKLTLKWQRFCLIGKPSTGTCFW
jgi:hypothetical protein